MRSLRVVAMGGGSGLSAVLRGLCAGRRAPSLGGRPVDLSAIVTTCDDGGSSGRLRREFGGPAWGDLRKCLAAVATCDERWVKLFGHRFGGCGDLQGHALGNLVLAALAEQLGDPGQAIRVASELLGAAARILPATLEPVRLWSELEDGHVVAGEAATGRASGQGRRRLRTLHLFPAAPAAAPGVLEALAAADLVVVGPGSLFTSLLPSLLVRGVAPVMAISRAQGARHEPAHAARRDRRSRRRRSRARAAPPRGRAHPRSRARAPLAARRRAARGPLPERGPPRARRSAIRGRRGHRARREGGSCATIP